MTAWKTDAKVRRAHLEAEVRRPERVAERAEQKRLLAVRIVLGASGRRRRARAGRRELTVRQQPPVRREQAVPPGWRVMYHAVHSACMLMDDASTAPPTPLIWENRERRHAENAPPREENSHSRGAASAAPCMLSFHCVVV